MFGCLGGGNKDLESLDAFHFFIDALIDFIVDRFKNETFRVFVSFFKKNSFLFDDADQVFQNSLDEAIVKVAANHTVSFKEVCPQLKMKGD